MILIYDTKIANDKNLKISLTKITGLNNSNITYLLKKLGISNSVKSKNLSDKHIKKLQDVIKKSNIFLNRDLKKYQEHLLEHLEKIKKYTFIKKKFKRNN